MKKIIIGDILDENMKCYNCGGDAFLIQKTVYGEKNERGLSNMMSKTFTRCCNIEIVVKNDLPM